MRASYNTRQELLELAGININQIDTLLLENELFKERKGEAVDITVECKGVFDDLIEAQWLVRLNGELVIVCEKYRKFEASER